jgi:hypothetical protein
MQAMKAKMEARGIEVVDMPAPEGLWAEAWKITVCADMDTADGRKHCIIRMEAGYCELR